LKNQKSPPWATPRLCSGMAWPGPVLPWPARYLTSSRKRPSMQTAVELDEHVARGYGADAKPEVPAAAAAANAGLAGSLAGARSAAGSDLGGASPAMQAKAEVSCTGR